MALSEVTRVLFRTIGNSHGCIPLALVAIVASAGCNSKISSKLVATKIIVPSEQGSEIEKDGVMVSVQPGTFSDPVEMDVEVSGHSFRMSTVTSTGEKVLSANVLKDVSFCAVVDPSWEHSKVYVVVEIDEGQAEATDRIPNSAIEFSEKSDKVRACWLSKYVNASFRLTMDRSGTTALKLTDPNCLDPDLSRIPNDEVLTLCDGRVANGSLELDNLLPENVKSGVVVGGVIGSVVPTPSKCASDGIVGCVTTKRFPSADTNGISPADLKSGKSIAGIAGSYVPDFPDAANVYNDTVNSVPGTLTLPAVGNVNLGVSYGVAGTGSTGTLTLPAAGNVLAGSGAFGNPGSAITPTLTLPSAANVKSGTGTYGNPGSPITPSYSPDLPEVANVYNDTVDGVSGTLTLPTVGNVYTGTIYGVAGTGSTGTLTVPMAANVRTGNGNFGQGGSAVTPTLADCSVDGGTGCVAVAGFKAADMTNVVAGKIKSGVTIAGVAGDYPSVTNPLAGADGTADLAFATFDAKIKAATNFEWFDSSGTRYVNSGDTDIIDSNILTTANIFGTQGTVTPPTTPDAWDIRVGQTINGVTGKLKVACRNSANTSLFDAAGEFKNATADNTTDLFTVTNHGYAVNDTIRFTASTTPTGLTATSTTYYVQSITANTFQLSATSGGGAIDFTTDGANIVVYKWGDGVLDIWDTVDDYNNAGTLFTAGDTPAAWSSDNFCGGVGVASSSAVWLDTTTDGPCDGPGDECRFKDKISGLEWSEFQSASATWGDALAICANLSFGGAGSWRLPTQKELQSAYEHGISSAENTNWITRSNMNENYFWSSSTKSNNMSERWVMFLDNGLTVTYPIGTMLHVVCVR